MAVRENSLDQMRIERETAERKRIRRFHITQRDAMTRETVMAKSRLICGKLRQSDWYENCSLIYGYYPLGNEVDCIPFLEQAMCDGKQIALPRTMENYQMEFYQIRSFKEVVMGRFHVMEPTENCPLMQKEEAIVLVPGVVFDEKGNRYGYGRGYYDRYLTRFPGLRPMALAYELQMEKYLVTEVTDVPMECIYTENRIFSRQKAGRTNERTEKCQRKGEVAG